MISVIIATYNGEKFIKEQLDSIRNQTLTPDEVIIRDDGSTDKTSTIIKSYIVSHKLKNWSFKINQKNKGFKRNFFDMLKLAQGDIIFLCDQDDVWHSKKIEVMSSFMEKNQQIQALNSGIELVDQELNVIKIKPRRNFYNANLLYSSKPLKKINFLSFDILIQRNISPGSSMCITKKIRNQFLKTYDFVLAHDWYINLITSLNNNCCFLNKTLNKYRIHPNNTIGLSMKWDIPSKIKSFRKDNEIKLSEFEKLYKTMLNINDNYNLNNIDFVTIKKYLRVRIAFLKNPNLQTLLHLREFKEYWNSTTTRGRILDFFLTINKIKKNF